MKRLLIGFAIVAALASVLESTGYPQEASAQTLVQQSILTWNAYVEPLPVAPATTIPTAQQLTAYLIYRGIGTAVCGAASVPLNTQAGTVLLATINKAVAPGITPTSFTDNTYPDQNGVVCWEIFVKFADGNTSQRSKRLLKEILSTKPIVANPAVQ